MAQNTENSTNKPGQTVVVSTPEPGQNITVQSSPGGVVELSFNPAEAEISRDGNDLVMELGEGSVRIDDFFTVGDAALPSFSLPDGVEISAEDFLAAQNPDMDLTTAAGSSTNTDSSGTAYNDDPGALLTGVNRLGDQGTFHWNRAVEPAEEMITFAYVPGGAVIFGLEGPDGVLVAGQVYEDGRPNQHLGDDTKAAGKLEISISPNPGNTVTGIHLENLHGGKLYDGDPNNGGKEILPGPDGNYHLTQSQLDNLYFQPDDNNSDADINFTIVVDFTTSTGGSTSIRVPGTIIVDAVADKPEVEETGLSDSSSTWVVGEQDSEHREENGWIKDELGKDENTLVDVTVKFTTTIRFSDFEDGSERHYALVEKPQDGNWSINEDKLPEGIGPEDIRVITLWFDADGNVIFEGPELPPGMDAAYSKEFFEIEVDNDLIDKDGQFELELELNGEGTSMNKDSDLELDSGAKAEETNLSGKELDDSNNVAYDIEKGEGHGVVVDGIDGSLSFNVGWASESNNDAKHLGAGNGTSNSYTPGAEAGVSDDSTGLEGGINTGAPIDISLNNPGPGEVFTEIELTLPKDAPGCLGLSDGSGTVQPLEDGMVLTAQNGSLYTVTLNGDGSCTFTLLSGEGVSDFGEFGLVYSPDSGSNSHDDVSLGYKVTVDNGKGGTAEFSGDTLIVVDAVADKPVVDVTDTDLTFPQLAGGEEGEQQSAAKPGDTITIKGGEIAFPDTSGKEDHKIVIGPCSKQTSITGGTITIHNADGTETTVYLSQENGTLSYSESENGPWTAMTESPAGSGRFELDIPGTAPKAEVELEVKIENGAGSGNQTINIGGQSSVETADGDREYDKGNNQANDSGTIKIPVSVVDGQLTVNVGSAYENAASHAHVGKDRPDTGQFLPGGNQGENYADDLKYLKDCSAKIAFSLSGKASQIDSEVLSGFTVSFKEGAGNLMIGDTFIPDTIGPDGLTITVDGKEMTVYRSVDADGNVTYTVISEDGGIPFKGDGSLDLDMHFVPGENNSHEDVELDFSGVIKETETGTYKPFGDKGDELEEKLQNDGHISSDGAHKMPGGAIAGNDTTAEVDAVAQKPHFTGEEGSGEGINLEGKERPESEGGGHYDKAVPGETITIPLKDVHLPDGDGSEHHYLYVQDLDGYDIEVVRVVCVDENGNEYTVLIDVSELQARGDDIYHKFDLDTALKNHNPPLNSSNIKDIEIDVKTPENPGDSDTIKVGILGHEDKEIVQGDNEQTLSNNDSYTGGEVDINYSGASKPGLIVSDPIYENAKPDANVGNENERGPVEIKVSTGDDNDVLVDFDISLKEGSEDLGDFYVFASEEAYNAYLQAVEDGVPPREALEQHGQKYDDLSKADVLDALNGDGKLVFMPSEDSNSGKNPEFDYSITVRDPDSGDEKTAAGEDSILSDAVAQKPDDLEMDAHGDGNIIMGQEGNSLDVTLKGTFTDLDDSTDHFMLIEAEAGWEMSYTNEKGETVKLGADDIVLGPDGKPYYKIPVTPDENGEASVDVVLTPPNHSVYEGEYEIEYGAMSKDNDTADGETTYHNNVAVEKGEDGLKGTLSYENGEWTFKQTDPLYEDNIAAPGNKVENEGDEANDFGKLVISHDDATHVEFDVAVDDDGNPVIVIYDKDGNDITKDCIDENGHVKIPLDENGNATVGIGVNPDYTGTLDSDQDIPLKDVIFSKDGEVLDKVGDYDLVVDSVADRPGDVEVGVSNNHDDDFVGGFDLNDGVAGSGDNNKEVHFTVKGDFSDTADGSESHYILVERLPDWEMTAPSEGVEEIYIDGKVYYRIDVTGKEDQELDITMKYTGPDRIEGDREGLAGSEDGVFDYNLGVGSMSMEKGNSNSGMEANTDNNISYVIDKEVNLQYSPVDSHLSMSVPDAVAEGESIPIGLGGIATDKSDVLEDLTITIKDSNPEGGKLYYLDGDKKIEIPLGPDGKADITDPDLLKGLSNGNGSLVYEPNGNGHGDINISVDGTVKDTVSGSTEDFHLEKEVVVDAQADGSENSYDSDPVKSTDNTTKITITTKFGDLVNDSEEHWVVLEQTSLDFEILDVQVYDSEGNILSPDQYELTVKYGSDGKPYYAVKVPQGSDYSVEFTVKVPDVKEDTEFKLSGGTIVVDTTTGDENNKESSLGNNWKEDIEDIPVNAGVVSTDKNDVDVSGSGTENGGDIVLSIVVGDRVEAENNEIVEGITISKLPPNGTLYLNGQPVQEGDRISMEDLQNGKLTFRPDENASGEFSFEYDIHVKDTITGETKDVGDKGTITVEGVPTPPEALTAEVREVTDSTLVLAISATFPDTEGEEHFFFVQAREGLTLEGYTLFTVGENDPSGLPPGDYYRIPAGDNSERDVSLELTFTVDDRYDGSELDVYAAAKENGETVVSPAETVDLPEIVYGGVHDFSEAAAGVNVAAVTEEGAYILGSDHADSLSASAGMDVLLGNDGDDLLFGGQGSDSLFGGAGNDTIFGGEDKDSLFGGKGNDEMTGGEGSDSFVWTENDLGAPGSGFTDMIKDFNLLEDRLDLKALFGEGDLQEGNPLHLENDSYSLNALLGEDNNGFTVTITSKGDEGGLVQTITGVLDHSLSLDAEQAQAALQTMIRSSVM